MSFTVSAQTGARAEIALSNVTAKGAVNTNVIIFGVVVRNNGGSDITYATHADNGDSFTINVNGVYSINACFGAGSSHQFAISKNATGTELTTDDPYLIASGRLLQYREIIATGLVLPMSITLPLQAGDIIRFHHGIGGGDPGNAGDNGGWELANICRVS